MNRRRGAGFTLIELMMVVAIVGILAVLGIYAVRRYLSSAKTAEARNSIGQMSKDAIAAYAKEGMPGTVVVVGSTASRSNVLCKTGSSVPTAIAAVQGKKYQSATGDWIVNPADTGFTCLKFLIDQPQYYEYSYAGTGTGNANDMFSATANGDLNADGLLSTFQITGQINSSQVLNVAPNMLEVNPEE